MADGKYTSPYTGEQLDGVIGGVINGLYNVYTFDSVNDMISGTTSNGLTVDLTELIGRGVELLGYNSADGGGGGRGVIRSGSHTEDGGRFFSVDSDTYIEIIFENIINVSQFGIFESTTSIHEQIYNANSASQLLGLPLVFAGDTTYTSTQNLSFNESINWISSISECCSSSISIPTDGGSGVLISTSEIGSTSLSQDIEMWNNVIHVDSTSSVNDGYLVAIESDKDFYGALSSSGVKKGHLVRVLSVLSSTELLIESNINDAYTLSEENVTITFYNPLSNVSINGIRFQKDLLSTSDISLELVYCYAPKIRLCAFERSKAHGMQFDKCYLPSCIDSYGADATNLYQFSSSGSYGVEFDNLITERCAKAVDLTGLSIPTRMANVSNCNDKNGGYDLEGNPMFITGTGFGSHTGCDGAIFYNCRTRDRYRGFYQRGISEKYINCNYYGAAALSPFQIENPKTVSISNCEYDCEMLPNKNTDEITFYKKITSQNILDIPNSFCTVWVTDDSGECGEFSIKNCRGYGVGQYFVRLQTSGVNYSQFEVSENYAFMVNTSSANDIAVIESSDSTSEVYNFVLENNTLQTNSGQTNVYKIGNDLSESIKVNKTNISIGEDSKTYILTLDNDTAQTINAGTRNDGIEVTVRIDSLPNYYGSGIIYKDGTLNSFGDNNFYVGSTFLSGTTGSPASDDTIGVSFTGSRVYIQNRTGDTQTVIIKVSSPI